MKIKNRIKRIVARIFFGTLALMFCYQIISDLALEYGWMRSIIGFFLTILLIYSFIKILCTLFDWAFKEEL